LKIRISKNPVLIPKKRQMTPLEISNYRLLSQKISSTQFSSAKEIVGWMGAMQAQDFAMAKWAVGIRLLNSTDAKIEMALNKGEIIRTHVMRPTWHFVSADDVYWLLDLTAGKIKSALKTRDKQLELSESLFIRSNNLIESVLKEGNHLSREELTTVFNNANIRTDDNRLSHIMLRAELEGIVCSGQIKGNKPCYSLLSQRVPRKKTISRDESICELAKRYFTSHGPATFRDFVWWSGLSVTQARKGLESIQSDFNSEKVGSAKYWFKDSFSTIPPETNSVYLLPAFDELIISYKDRSSTLSLIHNNKAVSQNGIFHPVIVANGQVTGIWKRKIKKDELLIEMSSFLADEQFTADLINKAALEYGNFLNKQIKLETFCI